MEVKKTKPNQPNLHKLFKTTSGFLQLEGQMRLSIFQAALDQLHMEISIFKIRHFKWYIFIQYVKVFEIGLLFLIITTFFFSILPSPSHCLCTVANHILYSSIIKPLKKSDEVTAGFAHLEGNKSLFAKMQNTDAWDVRKPGFHQLGVFFAAKLPKS